jgi:D-methionine transport system ATP-binding protein
VHTGRIVSIELQERRGFQASISRAFADNAIESEIIFGGISELQDRSVGSLTYELTGTAAGIERAIQQLRSADVAVAEEA